MSERVTAEKLWVQASRLREPDYWMSGSDQGHEGENLEPLKAAALLDRAADTIAALERERDEAREALGKYMFTSGVDALPDCMMPDGAEPCLGYQRLLADLKQLRGGE